MAERTLKCYGCKESFPKSQLINYASIHAKNAQNYCPKCLKEKQDREFFAEKVCKIFGLKSPGPRIWTERKRLIDNYGYTDSIIIDCLDYIYNIEKKKKLSESLFLVNPVMVDKMVQYKKSQNNEAMRLAAAMQTKTKEYVAPVQKQKQIKKIEYDPDEWLED